MAVGALTSPLVGRTVGRRSVRLRYLTLETARAMSVLGDVVPPAVARRVAQVHDGSPTLSAADSYARANGGSDVVEAPEWMGIIKPSRMLRKAEQSVGQPVSDDDLQRGPEEDAVEELDEDAESERSRILELMSTPFGFGRDALKKLLGAGRMSGEEGGAGREELRSGGSRLGGVGSNARVAEVSVDRDFRYLGPPVGRSYPEWDFRAQDYLADHCTVTEFDPRDRGDCRELASGIDPRLRRELARLGLAPHRHRRQADGDALDVTALVEYVVDRAAGSAADDRVYEMKRRTGHDLGVLVLLDVTGSTSDSGQGCRVFDEQRDLAARLIATLEEVGDRVAAFGFQSWGRDRVCFLRIKDFEDRFDHAARRRLAALEPGGFTRLGAAIRHASALLTEKSGVRNRLLVVIGDGLPYDDGYEHHHAYEDSRQALSEAVSNGVGCACLRMTAPGNERELERLWGHVPHLQLDQPSDLAPRILPLFRRALRQAEALGRDGRSTAAGRPGAGVGASAHLK